MRWAGFVFLVLSVLSGCARTTGHWQAGVFHQKKAGYNIRIFDENTSEPVMPNWRLSNYFRTQSGDGELRLKRGGVSTARYRFDIDGDGNFETSRDYNEYDLKFNHLLTDGVIKAITTPLSFDDARVFLEVLVKRFVRELNSNEWVRFRNQRVVLSLSRGTKAYLGPVEKVDWPGQEAARAQISIADRDNPSLKTANKILLYVFRPQTKWIVKKGAKETPYPQVVFFIYQNEADYFDQFRPDFESFVQRLKFEGP